MKKTKKTIYHLITIRSPNKDKYVDPIDLYDVMNQLGRLGVQFHYWRIEAHGKYLHNHMHAIVIKPTYICYNKVYQSGVGVLPSPFTVRWDKIITDLRPVINYIYKNDQETTITNSLFTYYYFNQDIQEYKQLKAV